MDTVKLKKAVQNHFKLNDITLRSRKRNIVEARKVFCYLLSEDRTRLKDELIAEEIKRNRTTAFYAIKSANNLVQSRDKIFIKNVEAVKNLMECK